jgi:hypothetical protein
VPTGPGWRPGWRPVGDLLPETNLHAEAGPILREGALAQPTLIQSWLRAAETPGRAGGPGGPAHGLACPQVRGFNLRKWLAANRKRVPGVLASLGKLAAAGKLQIATTECACTRRFAQRVAGQGIESSLADEWYGSKPVQLSLIACMAMQTLILRHLTVHPWASDVPSAWA